jgi:4-diphosphocytidyl-2-C-methyl-D-erythritol kinase
VSTAEAYGGVQPKAAQQPLLEVLRQDITLWKDQLINDFEPGIFKNHPELAVAKNKLLEEGAIYASMTGSGSTLYGIYDQRPEKSFSEIPVEVILPLC